MSIIRIDLILLVLSVLFLSTLGALMVSGAVRIYHGLDDREMGLVYLVLSISVGILGMCFHWTVRKGSRFYVAMAFLFVPSAFFMYGWLGIAASGLMFGVDSDGDPPVSGGTILIAACVLLSYTAALTVASVATIRGDLKSGWLPAGTICFALGIVFGLAGLVASVMGFMFSPAWVGGTAALACFGIATLRLHRAEGVAKKCHEPSLKVPENFSRTNLVLPIIVGLVVGIVGCMAVDVGITSHTEVSKEYSPNGGLLSVALSGEFLLYGVTLIKSDQIVGPDPGVDDYLVLLRKADAAAKSWDASCMYAGLIIFGLAFLLCGIVGFISVYIWSRARKRFPERMALG